MSTFESLVFYRGVSESNPTDHPYLKKTRKDREPKSSSKRFHDVANQWFKQKFGVAYRSEAIFVTSRKLSASAYAASENHLVRIIPTSTYRFCWSPNVSDLLFIAQEFKDASEEDINRRLDLAEYCEGDLQGAHTSGNEVMIFCEDYVCIPVLPDSTTEHSEKPFILIPGNY